MSVRLLPLVAATLARRSGLLALLTVLVALGMVGMHQLSQGHALVTSAATAPSHPHPDRPGDGSDPHDVSVAPGAAITHPERAAEAVTNETAAGCPGCDHHAMAAACLLALGLLSALVTARGPATRPTGRARQRTRQHCLPPRPGRARRALTLTELSISRT